MLGLKKPKGTVFAIVSRQFIDTARNSIVQLALNKGFTHVFFVDDDMTLHPDSLVRLLARKKDIVGGVYRIRGETKKYVACLQRKGWIYHKLEGFKKEGLHEVDAIGTGSLLITRKVLEKVWNKYKGFPFQISYKKHGGKLYSQTEDVNFCEKAQAVGFKIWADTTVRPGHIQHEPQILYY